MRLYPATVRSLLLAIVMGIGVWLLDSGLESLTAQLLGYDVPVPPAMYPQSVSAAALLFVGMALGAPLGSVPAGDFFAWRVSVEDETAWYDSEPPHTLLQYDSGPLIWQATSIAPAG